MNTEHIIHQFDEANQPSERAQGPVQCLGRTFASDDERRQHFRAELRRLLPELRQMEGFPLGSDDDIVALSDPPYYTACPNPWLPDFIAQWEQEKAQLLQAGKRQEPFEVKEPYASDVSEGKNNPIYMAHAYHTKVPHPAIMRYLLHYTQPGDIVLDGFCGTGMTGVAANLCGSESDVQALRMPHAQVGVRHAVCSDLSPIASLIAANYNRPFNAAEFQRKAQQVLQEVEREWGWMYETQVDGHKAKINYVIYSDVYACPSCGEEVVLWDGAVSEDTESMTDTFPCPHCGAECSKKSMTKLWSTQYDPLLKETVQLNKTVPVRVNYTVVGGHRGERPVNEDDLMLLQRINQVDISELHTEKLLEGGYNTRQPIDSNGVTHTHQFYTRRNFIYLSAVYEKVKDDVSLLAWFTSAVFNATQMYKFRTDRKGGLLNGTLYIPSLNIENCARNVLKNKLSDFVNTNYPTRGNSVVGITSATKLETLPNNSIDYIFTDPPFGANIMYSELNSIWESWLRVKTDNKEEAIVNKSQKKDLFDYQQLMTASLREYYRVLKPGRWITVEFSNTKASVWNSIQNALQGVGFVVVNVASLDKKQGSFKSVTTTSAVKQDLILTCYKPTDELREKFERSDNKGDNVWDFVEELLLHLPVHIERERKTTAVVERSAKILFDRVVAYYVQHGYRVPMDAQSFQRGLKERFVERDGMFFTALQAIEYDERRKETQAFENYSLMVSSESEGIEWLRRKLDSPQTYQELQPEWMQNLIPRKGDTIPELRTLLEENFLCDEDGRWRNPDPEKEADLEKVRTKRLLKEFQAYTEGTGRIREARLEALHKGFEQCYDSGDFDTLLRVAKRLPESLLTEDEKLLTYYDIASSRL